MLTITDLNRSEELSSSGMAKVVGGDDRENALVGLYDVLAQMELDEIDVEPVLASDNYIFRLTTIRTAG